MTRIVEQQHPGEPTWLWRLGNATAIGGERVRSIGIAWGFRENGRWRWRPRITGQQSLFFNAVVFVRLTWVDFMPVGFFASVRWSPSSTAKALLQTGIGWKLNGRLAVLFRIQSDQSSAAGVTGPNSGQAPGFEYGTH
ncbi:hypothetical protein HCX48_00545 [Rhodocyclus tenuis]|uniref:Uncharacterized protein n=1 Tax=Rhodocyclus gracilis TaxID=2929842 RepID=A0ABX0WDE5_9RHOO|nr:hypothetical protein [Rhodocyclus gracilis]MRD73284.1 hypothetical protein [Rhodocyclus gracilis]NJA87715.1 hypothetical protein [Rhodocyclus gracilis]